VETAPWISKELEFFISYCLHGFGYCTALMLAMFTDVWWKISATYFNTIKGHHFGIML
jgi:hypothetical protein